MSKKDKGKKDVVEIDLEHVFSDRKGEPLYESSVEIEEINRVARMRAQGFGWQDVSDAMNEDPTDAEAIPKLTLRVVAAVELEREEVDDRGKSKLTPEKKIRRTHLATRIMNAKGSIKMTVADKKLIMDLIGKNRSSRITTQSWAILDPVAYEEIVSGADKAIEDEPDVPDKPACKSCPPAA